MKLNKSGKFKAPIEVIFDVLTDIEVWREEISLVVRRESFKFNYDRKKPFEVGNRIILSMGSSILIATTTHYEHPYLLTINFEPNKKYLEFFGTVRYLARLEKINEKKTKYSFTYESSKKPKGILKIFILAYFHCSFYFANKRVKKCITSRLKNRRLATTL